MDKSTKSEQMQLRVSREEKRAIQRAAAQAGMDMSAYVLSRVVSAPTARFQELGRACAGPAPRYALAELNSLLSGFTAGQLKDAVFVPPPANLTPYFKSYIAAMVELVCAKRAIAAPFWTREVAPLAEPVFASSLEGLRLYLLTHSPPPFRRRNIFIDSSVGKQI
jgi:hypothetical protein